MFKRSALFLGMVAATMLIANGCSRQQHPSPATVKTVEKYPDAYYGQQVTVSGEVDKVFSQSAFELKSGGTFFGIGSNQVLVLAKDKIALGDYAIQDNLRLQITGNVRQFNADELEQMLGWEIDPEMEAN